MSETRYSPREFAGETYEPDFDKARLTRLQDRVEWFAMDGTYRTLGELQALCGGSEASISARLRDAKKKGWTLEKRRRGNPKAGLYEYRLTPHESEVIS